MRNSTCFRYCTWVGLSVVLAMTGCANLPWLSPPPPPTPKVPSAASHPAGEGKPPDLVQAHFLPPTMNNDQVSLLLQQLGNANDDRKVLLVRIQMLEMQLHGKDQLLLKASKELQAAKKEMDQTQTHSKKWKSEIDVLHNKLENNETENVQALKEVIGTLEQLLKQKQQ